MAKFRPHGHMAVQVESPGATSSHGSFMKLGYEREGDRGWRCARFTSRYCCSYLDYHYWQCRQISAGSSVGWFLHDCFVCCFYTNLICWRALFLQNGLDFLFMLLLKCYSSWCDSLKMNIRWSTNVQIKKHFPFSHSANRYCRFTLYPHWCFLIFLLSRC